MLSHHERQEVINILNDTLGIGTSMKNDEQAHHCPFCHHHKKKLQINLKTQQWHCWVCDAKGKRIQRLLKRLNVNTHKLKKIYEIYGDDYVVYSNETEDEKIELRLPSEFKSLLKVPDGKIITAYKQALKYAKDRGITKEDITRYNIGYCDSGMYSNRIIIPSYDMDNRLNYFIARSVFAEEKFKYKNPPVSKNVIMFENQINWNEPITLVEGVFDAIAVKRNSIPILGKFVPKKLNEAIFKNGVKSINILLDEDAQGQALHYTMQFQNQGITTKNIKPTDKDAADMGFSEVNIKLKESKKTGFGDIISQKLKNI
jgi:DNA primase|tara:strand:+ start:591 stop:1535 length:945 start_codon:yes stop_codon:yes gene_type:complete